MNCQKFLTKERLFIDGYKSKVSNSGLYLENTSTNVISSVNVTINNVVKDRAVWIYTIIAEGQNATDPWLTVYQENINPAGGFTDTYTIKCHIPPGGAFIVNSTQIIGEVIFNEVIFD